MKKTILLALCAIACSAVFGQDSAKESTHLSHIRQLTYGGDNAEAYFSFDDKNLSCQVTNPKW